LPCDWHFLKGLFPNIELAGTMNRYDPPFVFNELIYRWMTQTMKPTIALETYHSEALSSHDGKLLEILNALILNHMDQLTGALPVVPRAA
jgi:hypothetical protein